jgi:large subunit ribosomal protein L21
MFAVIKTGGKQYRVAANDVLKVERLAAEQGDTVTFDEVLLVGDADSQSLGTPLVEGACVAATVLDQGRADKIIVFKKKRRKNYRRTKGHRQLETVVRITEILTAGKKPAAKKAAPKKAEAKTEADDKPEAAPKKAAPKKAEAGTKSEAKTEAKKPAAKKAAPKKAPAKTGTKTKAAKAAGKDEEKS